MRVLKFGGTSVANAERITHVANIVQTKLQENTLLVVVSAMAGITDTLESLLSLVEQQAMYADANRDYAAVEKLTAAFEQPHQQAITELSERFSTINTEHLNQHLAFLASELKRQITATLAIGICPEKVKAELIGFGEQMTVQLLNETLVAQQIESRAIDSRDYIITRTGYNQSKPNLSVSYRNIAELVRDDRTVTVAGGFIAKNALGESTTLGRNGSDFSAAIFAAGINAKALEIWTDVDGVFSADPRVVADAQKVPHLTYEEAKKLSLFGAKVLHPTTIEPVSSAKIPLFIRNTGNPEGEGTYIFGDESDSEMPIRGVSSVDNIAMIRISMNTAQNLSSVNSRVFHIISKLEIPVALLAKTTSTFEVDLCFRQADVDEAYNTLCKEFTLEIKANIIDINDPVEGLSLISIVGNNLRAKPGIGRTFFNAFSEANINVHTTVQGIDELTMSAVVSSKDCKLAVKMVHKAFFNPRYRVALYIVGSGLVSSALISQIKARRDALLEENIRLDVCGISNSKTLLENIKGLDLDNWQEKLQEKSTQEDPEDTIPTIERILNHIHRFNNNHAILVDCTASEEISLRYEDVLNHGVSVVTANKQANTMSYDYYQNLRNTAWSNQVFFAYETNVGAGLPIIDTLQRLIRSGDDLVKFEGILSGSLSAIFGLLEEGYSFSQAVNRARDAGFTEPDPRDDLSGLDVARKLLIISRECGGKEEIDNVELKSLLPEDFDSTGSVDEFMERLPQVDGYFSDWQATLSEQGKRLRCVGSITKDGLKVGLQEVDEHHPLFSVKGGENAFAFTTRFYQPTPLVIRGYGAGAQVTGAGVFGDVLKMLDKVSF